MAVKEATARIKINKLLEVNERSFVNQSENHAVNCALCN
jgi:hypothetical protein